jgi:hypothetical protein
MELRGDADYVENSLAHPFQASREFVFFLTMWRHISVLSPVDP